MSESTEQRAVIKWFRSQYPQYRLIAIPNGQWVAGAGNRRFALINKYKAEGMTNGVSDLFLAYPSNGYAGLWLEMKSKGKHLTDHQLIWMEAMLDVGYATGIAFSFEEAKQVIDNYLKEADK